MKNNKGITLVALVITIIVLIILAAVSIAALTGDNSIITNAQKSKKDTEEKGAIEQINIALSAIKTSATAKLVADGNYDVSDDANQSIYSYSELGLKEGSETAGYYIDPKTIGTDGVITITYKDASLGIDVEGKIDFKLTKTGTTDSTGTTYGTITPAAAK